MLDGHVGTVEPEDHDGPVFPPEREGVHIFDIHAARLQRFQQAYQAAGTVVHLHCHHLGLVDHVPGLTQQFPAPLPIGNNQPQDSELLRIRQRQRADVDPRAGQQAAGFHGLARTVFEEKRELMDLHGSLRSITLLALPSLRWMVWGPTRRTLTRSPRVWSSASASRSCKPSIAPTLSLKNSGVTST